MCSRRFSHCLLCIVYFLTFEPPAGASSTVKVSVPKDSSPLREKAAWFEKDLLDKHWLDGLYVSIVPSVPPGTKLQHTVDEPGNVIHAGVWTGRYLAGVGYQYGVTRDPSVRQQGGQILHALTILEEVTGKPGLLARGYVKGHGPVEGWERNGADSREWHQGQGAYAGYRWYGDVSVDNFNAVLYGYAIYYDLAADAAQKKLIARNVDRLMTHLVDNHCRIIDVDGEVTQWGHIGIDPDPAFDDYYKKYYAQFLQRSGQTNAPWQPGLRSSLMLLPDLLIADHITGNPRYRDLYARVVARFRDNPDARRERDHGPFSLERLARVNHSSEGQSYEALYNLIRYEHDPGLLEKYRPWVGDLWEMNWMEGNPIFTFMTLALQPEYHGPSKPGQPQTISSTVPNASNSIRLALESLHDYPIDRNLRPVMNSLRKDIELNPYADRQGQKQSAQPVPINRRPLDNEYAWKGNPYQLDGWLKPALRMIQFASDDATVAWACDSSGRIFMTRDGGKNWRDMSTGLMGASVESILASTNRTFVVYAKTDRGIMVTRDGGLSWRTAAASDTPAFPSTQFVEWQPVTTNLSVRIDKFGELMKSLDRGHTSVTCMRGWRIPLATAIFVGTPWGIIAGGPGGCYRSQDAENWIEIKLWPEEETGAADFLHAYWMGRYYGFISKNE
ncbi:MAG: hypothetical protein JWM99_2224 [Verrucomicrobiales bacterium]|nr:hypothetical protein [Verrucomicrobiales bacterium]